MARKEINWAQQGARFEREVIHDLSGSPDGSHKGYGFTCMRSAASKGTADILAIASTWTRQSLLVQCKRTDPLISPTERRALVDLSDRLCTLPVVAYRIGTKVVYRRLTGTGPKDWCLWHPSFGRLAYEGVGDRG